AELPALTVGGTALRALDARHVQRIGLGRCGGEGARPEGGIPLVAPREPVLDLLAELPGRPGHAKRELREAHLHVLAGVLDEEARQIVPLHAHRPLDFTWVAAGHRAPALERLHLRHELGGPVREHRVPDVRVLRYEAKRKPLADASDRDWNGALGRWD